MQDGNEAAKELERCMKQLKFKGVEILTNVAGKELSDPAFAPFWKKAEELGALVMIHPNGFTASRNASRASTSTTSSAIRSIPRSPCTT